jgi:hypothetical protein
LKIRGTVYAVEICKLVVQELLGLTNNGDPDTMKGVLAGGQAAGSVGGVLPMGGAGEGLNPFSCYAPRGTGGTTSSMLQHSMADQFTLSQVRFSFYYLLCEAYRWKKNHQ